MSLVRILVMVNQMRTTYAIAIQKVLDMWLVAPLKPKFDRMLDFEFLLMCKKSDWKFLSKKFICRKILTMLMEVIFL